MKLTKSKLKEIIKEEFYNSKDSDWDVRIAISYRDSKTMRKLILRNDWDAESGGGKDPKGGIWFKIKAKGGKEEILKAINGLKLEVIEIDESFNAKLDEINISKKELKKGIEVDMPKLKGEMSITKAIRYHRGQYEIYDFSTGETQYRYKKLEDVVRVANSIWGKDDVAVESLQEVAGPFSYHLRTAQDEIEYMISNHKEAEEEGVYAESKNAIKQLLIAQKALNKIK